MRFEDRIGSPLPPDYRRFLLEHNGGRPETEFWVDPPGVSIDNFFSLGKRGLDSVYDLEWNRRTLGLSSAYLPIATDAGGNALALCLIGDDAGAVYFWDHESDELTWVAPTFSGLLEEQGAALEAPAHETAEERR